MKPYAPLGSLSHTSVAVTLCSNTPRRDLPKLTVMMCSLFSHPALPERDATDSFIGSGVVVSAKMETFVSDLTTSPRALTSSFIVTDFESSLYEVPSHMPVTVVTVAGTPRRKSPAFMIFWYSLRTKPAPVMDTSLTAPVARVTSARTCSIRFIPAPASKTNVSTSCSLTLPRGSTVLMLFDTTRTMSPA